MVGTNHTIHTYPTEHKTTHKYHTIAYRSMSQDAKNQVNECEKEIAAIKARIKSLGPASETEESKNSLTVTLVKVRRRYGTIP